MKHFCYIPGTACAVFWHNLLNRFIFSYLVRSNTNIPPGCREEKTKRFNKYPVVVCACVHTYARAWVGALVATATGALQTTPNPGTRPIKTFYGKNPPL